MTPDDCAKLIKALKKECPNFEVTFYRKVDAITGETSDITWDFKWLKEGAIWGDWEYGKLRGFIEGWLASHSH
jgi:hypothetical protein